MRVLAIAGAFCIMAATAHAQNCHVPLIRTLENQTVDGYMTVKSGKRCSIVLQYSSGPTTTTQLVAAPAVGKASVSGHRITYLPRPGYTGPDRFTYARSGQDRFGRPTVRTVNVNVTVAP